MSLELLGILAVSFSMMTLGAVFATYEKLNVIQRRIDALDDRVGQRSRN